MTKASHRVIVVFSELSRRPSGCAIEKHLDNDLQFLNERTILLRTVNSPKTDWKLSARYYRPLQFDAVGFESELHIRSEMNDIIDDLFRQKKNACVIRVTSVRNSNLNMITRLLVAEVDRVMMSLRYRLSAINIEYYDVRKFDMINMLGQQMPPPRIMLKGTRSIIKAHLEETVQRKSLQCTRDLFQWLLSEYNAIRARATGDDYIDVEYIFIDNEMKKYSTHLSIFQVYINGSENRNDLMSFFKSINSGKNSKRTLLTDCLKESFDMKNPMRTLLMFELSLSKETHENITQLCTLADAAFNSIGLAKAAAQEKPAAVAKTKQRQYKRLPSVSSKYSNSSKTVQASATKSSLKHTHKSISGSYSKEDYNTLSSWYNRIDEKIAEVTAAMLQYYHVQYQNKALRICKEIKCAEAIEDVGDNNNVLMDERQAGVKYFKILEEFQCLQQEVEQSCYADILKVYLSTKSYELKQIEQDMKQKQATNLRDSVAKYVENELVAI